MQSQALDRLATALLQLAQRNQELVELVAASVQDDGVDGEEVHTDLLGRRVV